MTEEFKLLKELVKENKLTLRFKNSSDPFGIWLHWICKLKPSALNLYGYLFHVYFVLTMDWLWLPLAIFVGFKFGWLYGVLAWVIHYIIQKHILSGIGQGFMAYDALKDEDLLDALWENHLISLASDSKKKSHETGAGLPELFIYPPQNWRSELQDYYQDKEKEFSK